MFSELPGKLCEVPREVVVEIFKSHKPKWNWDAGYPEMTCALATGVGKTRLMGTFMTYLFKAGESKHFLLLAPRTTIVDKLVRECHPDNPKYIFVDKGLVSEPLIYQSGTFDRCRYEDDSETTSPTIWIASPQGIARTEPGALRFHRPNEYLGTSLFEYLRSLPDLVVFFDESHHLGEEQKGELPVWTRGVRELSPRLLFSMTASPSSEANILHQYALTECLKEGLYTKEVQVVVKQRPEGIDDLEWDKNTIRFALSRLDVKLEALKQYSRAKALNGNVQPILLVCAKDIHHAEEISTWISSQIGSDSVLLVHSGMQESEYMGRLLSVEQPGQKVRVIVNVFKLTEGWDVTNVYVISPLRALATATGVLQTMGRGLRLPFGRRVNDSEVDTLDVLCFGRETMNEIVDQVLSEGFGNRDSKETFLEVVKDDEVEMDLGAKNYQMLPEKELTLSFPNVDLEMPELDLSQLQIPSDLAREALAIDLSDPVTIRRLQGKLGFDWEVFTSLVTALVMRKRKVIGSLTKAREIESTIEKYLLDAGITKGGVVRIEPELAALHVVKAIDSILAHSKAKYKQVKGTSVIQASHFDLLVPHHFEKEIECVGLSFENWKPMYKGYPIGGWSRCVYKAVPFDNATELHVAKIIDRSEEVELWLRNLHDIFKLSTPIGFYSPDFLFILKMKSINVLLEVKGEHLISGAESDAIVKASAAESWCEAVNSLGENRWEYWLIIDKDARNAQSIDDLRKIAQDWRSLCAE